MQSDATTVDYYLAEVPTRWHGPATIVRQACLEILDGFEERMEYGMPGYARDGALEVGFAAQARYLSLYLLRQGVVHAHRDQLAGLSVGKGCVRFTTPAKVDDALVRTLLRATVSDEGALC